MHSSVTALSGEDGHACGTNRWMERFHCGMSENERLASASTMALPSPEKGRQACRRGRCGPASSACPAPKAKPTPPQVGPGLLQWLVV